MLPASMPSDGHQMSWCAGFGPQFWEGYRSLIPQDEGFLDRKPLYDAYHQVSLFCCFAPSMIVELHAMLTGGVFGTILS